MTAAGGLRPVVDPAPGARPKVLIVGGPDVDARIGLIRALRDRFDIGAVGSSPAIAGRFAQAGIPYDAYALSRGVDPVGDLRAVLALTRLFRQRRPDLVHTFDGKPGIWARWAARRARVPVVVGTLPGLGMLYAAADLKTRLVRAIYEPLQRWACHGSDVTIFQNTDDTRDMIDARVVPADRARIIAGSGIDTSAFAPGAVDAATRARVRAELGVAADQIAVVMISRVIRTKGVLDLAEAARLVAATHPSVRFVLVGPDDEDSIDRLGASERASLSAAVRWVGPRTDVAAVLAASDVFVLPTYYREGIPRVLLEAAATGLPLVATDTPGCRDVVVDGLSGVRVPPRDALALATAVRSLADDPLRRMALGVGARSVAVERFDDAIVHQAHAALYSELLDRRRAAPAPARLMPATRGQGVDR